MTGTCTAIHLGRTLTTHEIVMTDEQGRRLSTARITNMMRDNARFGGPACAGTPASGSGLPPKR